MEIRRPPEPTHMPQLDTLRAFAVLAVLASHFCPSSTFWVHRGPQGVNLFFVLSGFLITGILLECRTIVAEPGQSVGATMGRFYARRALRLLPLLYATLLVAWLLDVREVRESFWWHVGYLTNVYFTRTGGWHFPLAHLWSLAVEEQFYLVWPAMILLAPRRLLVPFVVAVVASAPLFRVLAPGAGVPDMALWTLPFGKLDALGVGGLLALSTHGEARAGRWPGWLRLLVAPAAVLTFYPFLGVRWMPPPLAWLYRLDLWQTAVDVLFAALVLGAAYGWTGVVGRVASWRPLVWLGRISYGVYLLHLFVKLGVQNAVHWLGVPWPGSELLQFLVFTTVTVAAAAVSWRYFEQPLNRLKRRMPYRVAPAVIDAAPPEAVAADRLAATRAPSLSP